jgi:hypothetical protein
MRRSKDGSKALGAIGASLSLAGAAALAGSTPAQAAVDHSAANARTSLHEVEMLDVTLGSFRLFDREDAKDVKGDAVAWWGCRGCRGCCRGCGWGCRGCCRGCRGCAG